MVNMQRDDKNREEPQAETPAKGGEEAKRDDDDEFKITVKKLDRFVRPRGVLADG